MIFQKCNLTLIGSKIDRAAAAESIGKPLREQKHETFWKDTFLDHVSKVRLNSIVFEVLTNCKRPDNRRLNNGHLKKLNKNWFLRISGKIGSEQKSFFPPSQKL